MVCQPVISILLTNVIQQQTQMRKMITMATPHQRGHAVVVMDTDVNAIVQQELEHHHHHHHHHQLL